MLARELRKKKILTNEEVMQIIREIRPVIINQVDYYFTITDMTGLQTSHVNDYATVVRTHKELIDALPPDVNINIIDWINFLVGDGLFLDSEGKTFMVETPAEV